MHGIEHYNRSGFLVEILYTENSSFMQTYAGSTVMLAQET